LQTDTPTFGVMLLGIVLLPGTPLFLPATAFGPVAEYLAPIPFGG
jgi:K+-transporting ATPase ATPase A chain